jgi:hypothetical protein
MAVNQNLATTPLGSSSDNDGISYQQLSGGTNASPTTESVNAASGVLTLINDAATDTLTGYYNGAPVGSISLASWGPSPSLLLAVVGFSAYGINVPAGTDTASNFFAGFPLQITTAALPNGTNGAAYSQTLTATGGQTPYGWTNGSDALPQGLQLSADGVISGTPTTNGTFNLTVKVTDALSQVATQAIALTVVSLQVTTIALPNGTNGFAYYQQLSAIDGQPPYSWTNSSGALPTGLTLAANGVISGTPTTNGTFNLTVKVTDALSQVATQALALTVGSPPSVVWIQPTNNSVAVTAGNNVTFAVSVAGTGPVSYQWRLNGTNLPDGIITTVAGNGDGYGNVYGIGSYSGDGNAATNAGLSYPSGVAPDTTGDLFIADTLNHRIRKVGANGIITTVAGNGTNGYSGDGLAATSAELTEPPAWRWTPTATCSLRMVSASIKWAPTGLSPPWRAAGTTFWGTGSRRPMRN